MQRPLLSGLLDRLKVAQPEPSQPQVETSRSSAGTGTDLSRPIIVAHASQLSAVRDFVTHDLSGIPLIVMRQEDGSLKAFLNVCRHRGVRVVTADAGNRRSFTCPYHGWTYGPDGCLRGIPHRNAFESIDRDERGLREIPVAERHGLVWVGLRPGGALDPVELVGSSLDSELAEVGLADLVVERSQLFEEPDGAESAISRVLEGFLDSAPVQLTDQLGAHRRVAIPGRRFDQVGQLNPDGYDPRQHLALIYSMSPNHLLAWRGGHAELWGIFGPSASHDTAVGSLSLLVPSQQAEATEQWDLAWENAQLRIPAQQ
jgi:nitrite reductase/ring-hydroxylating ferredoxin subunit